MSLESNSILCNGNLKLENKIKLIDNLVENIQFSQSKTVPSDLENLFNSSITTLMKDISPALVKKNLDLIAFYLNKFEFYQIPIGLIVNYMIENQTARVKETERCQGIFKKLYLLLSEDLLSLLSQIIAKNKQIYILHAYSILNYLATLKQFGSISKKFRSFSRDSFPILFNYLLKSNNPQIKKGTYDFIMVLINQMGIGLIDLPLSKIDQDEIKTLRKRIESHLQIVIRDYDEDSKIEKAEEIEIKIYNFDQNSLQGSNLENQSPSGQKTVFSQFLPPQNENTIIQNNNLLLKNIPIQNESKSQEQKLEEIDEKSEPSVNSCLSTPECSPRQPSSLIYALKEPFSFSYNNEDNNFLREEKSQNTKEQSTCTEGSLNKNNTSFLSQLNMNQPQQNLNQSDCKQNLRARLFSKSTTLSNQKLIQNTLRKPQLAQQIKKEKERVFVDYNTFNEKCNKDKLLMINGLYQGITEGYIKLGDNPFTPQTLLDFFSFRNTCGIITSIKIFKIYLLFQESKLDTLQSNLRPYILKIMIALIKSVSVSKVLLYSVISLVQTVHELQIFNREILFGFIACLLTEQPKIQIHTLEILSNYIMRNSIQDESLFHEILQKCSILASSSATSKIRTLALQILIQAQQKIGDQINNYLTPLRYQQLKAFKKATTPIINESNELSLKENMKFKEIESMVYSVDMKNKDQLINLISTEIDYYNKKQQGEHSLNYNKIFAELLKSQRRIAIVNTLSIISGVFQKFKPSQILNLFDIILQIKTSNESQKIVLFQMIKYHGVSMFYPSIIQQITVKKSSRVLIPILTNLINDMSQPMLSEIMESILPLIQEDQMELNNIIYHFFAYACIQKGEAFVETIIYDKYFFAEHLLKKIDREKQKCLYLIHLMERNNLNSVSTSEQQQHLDMESFLNDSENKAYLQNETSSQSQNCISGLTIEKVLNNESQQDDEENYSFIQGYEEDEI